VELLFVVDEARYSKPKLEISGVLELRDKGISGPRPHPEGAKWLRARHIHDTHTCTNLAGYHADESMLNYDH